MHRGLKRSRILSGLGIASVAIGYGGVAAASASAATQNPTVTHVVCPKNVIIGQAAACGVSVSDVGSPTQGAPTGVVTLQTNTGGGTFKTSSSSGTQAVCTLVPVDSRTSRCSFTYTATAPGNTRIYANYGGDAKHQPSFGFTDVIVNP